MGNEPPSESTEEPNNYPQLYAQVNPGILVLHINKMLISAPYSINFPHKACLKFSIFKVSSSIPISAEFDADNCSQINKPVSIPIKSLYKTDEPILQCAVINQSGFLPTQYASAELNLSDEITKKIKEGSASLPLIKQGQLIGRIDLTMKYVLNPYCYLSLKINKVFTVHISQSQAEESWKIYCKIKIGEMSLQTSPKDQSQTEIPSWNDEVMIFKVPSGLQTGVIEVYQLHQGSILQLGTVGIDIEAIVSDFQEHEYSQKIQGKLKDSKVRCVGSLSFQAAASKSREFTFPEPLSALPAKGRPRLSNNPAIWTSTNQSGFLIFRKKEKTVYSPEEGQPESNQQERETIKRMLLAPLPRLHVKASQQNQESH